MNSKLIEAGHYYACTWPTLQSHIGMQIAHAIKGTNDHILLFIDDVHTSHTYEDDVPGCWWEDEITKEVTYQILESETVDKALELCDILQAKYKGGEFYYQGIKLTKDKGTMPTCIAMDSILTLFKREKWYDQLINILPATYQKQQEQLQVMMQGMKYKNILPEHIKLLSLLFSWYECLDCTAQFKQQIKEVFYPSYSMIWNM